MPADIFRFTFATLGEARIHYSFKCGHANVVTSASLSDSVSKFQDYAIIYATFKAVSPVFRRYVNNRIGIPNLTQDEFNALFWSAMQSPAEADWLAFIRQQASNLSLSPGITGKMPQSFYSFSRKFSRCGGDYWQRMLYLSSRPRAVVGYFEQCGAAVGLVLFLPVFAVVAFAIFFILGRPVFYCQERAGKDGKPFLLYKFRTMFTHGEYQRRVGNGGWHVITQGNDDRISPLGRILRRFKVDELPQLINIFKGDMEIIGFRPEIGEKVDLMAPEYAVLCQQKPGLSDPASLVFIDEAASIAALQSRGASDVYDKIILPLKTRLSTAYMMKRALSISDPAIIILTLFHSQAGAGDPSKIPDPPYIPAVPEQWAKAYYSMNEL